MSEDHHLLTELPSLDVLLEACEAGAVTLAGTSASGVQHPTAKLVLCAGLPQMGWARLWGSQTLTRGSVMLPGRPVPSRVPEAAGVGLPRPLSPTGGCSLPRIVLQMLRSSAGSSSR